jgi:hypothetical protein
MEAKHDFILVFDGVPDLTDEVADALYESGCDDGTFMMRSGLMYGAFHRVAPHIDHAVAGAIRDVRRANIGARFVRAQRDMAGTEIPDDDMEMKSINSTISYVASYKMSPNVTIFTALTEPDPARSIGPENMHSLPGKAPTLP